MAEIIKESSSLLDAKYYIDALDFSQIIRKMVDFSDWYEEDAVHCAKLYKNFLYLLKKYDELLPPSEEIDEFWHQHILDTQKYFQDCQAIFGKYLHHYPYLGTGIDGSSYQDLEKAFEKTQELYFKEFGEYL